MSLTVNPIGLGGLTPMAICKLCGKSDSCKCALDPLGAFTECMQDVLNQKWSKPDPYLTRSVLQIVKLDKNAFLPKRATDGSAGYDLVSNEDYLVDFSDPLAAKIDTGLAVKIPDGYVGLVVSRSGLARKGLVVANAPGVIDSDYTGPLCVLMRYLQKNDSYRVVRGDRIAQLLIVPVFTFDIEIRNTLQTTTRGDGGFGSTGK